MLVFLCVFFSMVNESAILTYVFVLSLMFSPFDQLLIAAAIGRANDIVELVAEGVNIEFKDQVRSLVSFLCAHRVFDCVVCVHNKPQMFTFFRLCSS